MKKAEIETKLKEKGWPIDRILKVCNVIDKTFDDCGLNEDNTGLAMGYFCEFIDTLHGFQETSHADFDAQGE